MRQRGEKFILRPAGFLGLTIETRILQGQTDAARNVLRKNQFGRGVASRSCRHEADDTDNRMSALNRNDNGRSKTEFFQRFVLLRILDRFAQFLVADICQQLRSSALEYTSYRQRVA